MLIGTYHYSLNRFFTILGDPILMNNGIIYQYAGDEIVGLFGTEGGTAEEKNATQLAPPAADRQESAFNDDAFMALAKSRK